MKNRLLEAVKETRLFLIALLGKDSPMNLLGKIVLHPFILIIALELFLVVLLFAKNPKG